MNWTVWSSGVSIDSIVPSSEDGPLGSWISSWRSKLNFTSEDVSSLPLAKVRPSLSFTSYVLGSVKSADSAMSGSVSAVPGVYDSRKGNTCCITKNEPLSYEPAGSSTVTLSVVPTVRAPPPSPSPL